jgi:hypothetical protein
LAARATSSSLRAGALTQRAISVATFGRGSKIGSRHVRTLMQRGDRGDLLQAENIGSCAWPHPYLVRGLTIDRANQVWASDTATFRVRTWRPASDRGN